MSSLVLVDTSVLLNVLDVPGRNEHRDTVLDEFAILIENGDSLFIPMAAIFETGNHIAQIKDGGQTRREVAARFVETVKAALEDEAPWKPMSFPSDSHLLTWLSEFPEQAMRQIGMGGACGAGFLRDKVAVKAGGRSQPNPGQRSRCEPCSF